MYIYKYIDKFKTSHGGADKLPHFPTRYFDEDNVWKCVNWLELQWLIWTCFIFLLFWNECLPVHAEKYFPNLIKSNRNLIKFSILRMMWIHTEVRLILNQPENPRYHYILVCFNRIQKRFLCMCVWEFQVGISFFFGLATRFQ